MATAKCAVCGQKIKINKKDNEIPLCFLCQALSPLAEKDTIQNIKYYYNIMMQRAKIFKTTREYSILLGSTIVVDENNQLFYEKDKKNHYNFIYRFEDIVSYDIKVFGEKTVTKTKGGVGRAITGGLLFGPAGAVVGASTAKTETKTEAGSSFISIRLNYFGADRGISMDHWSYNLPFFLDNCIKMNNSKEAQLQDNRKAADNIQQNASIADELLKFKQLLDAGIITQDEFEIQKKKILNQ